LVDVITLEILVGFEVKVVEEIERIGADSNFASSRGSHSGKAEGFRDGGIDIFIAGPVREFRDTREVEAGAPWPEVSRRRR